MVLTALGLLSIAITSPLATASETSVVWVRVVDDEGPVGNATVTFAGGYPHLKESAQSTGGGTYFLETVSPGSRVLNVSAPGYCIATERVPVSPGLNESRIIFLQEIPALRPLTILVNGGRDQFRMPLQYAEVTLSYDAPSMNLCRSEAHAETSSNGAVILPAPGEGRATLSIKHDFYKPQTTEINLSALPADPRVVEADLSLSEPHFLLTGEARAETGTPLGGVTVELLLPIGRPESPFWMHSRSTATTDGSGRFYLAVPPSPVRLDLTKEGYFPGTLELRAFPDAEPSVLTLTPKPPRTALLYGRVTNTAGEPLPGVGISAISSEGNLLNKVETNSDPDGRFEVLTSAAAQKLYLSCTESCAKGRDGLDRIIRVDATSGTNPLGTIVLETDNERLNRQNATGTIVDGTGRAIHKARVLLYDHAKERVIAIAIAREDGTFTIPACQHNSQLLIVAGPAEPEDSLFEPTGFESRLMRCPINELTVGRMQLTSANAASATLNLRVLSDRLILDMITSLESREPIVANITLDGVLGDGDGEISEAELEQAASLARKLNPLPIERLTLELEDERLPLQTKPPSLRVHPGSRRFEFLQEASVIWPVADRGGLLKLRLSVPSFTRTEIRIVTPDGMTSGPAEATGWTNSASGVWISPGQNTNPKTETFFIRLGEASRPEEPPAPPLGLDSAERPVGHPEVVWALFSLGIVATRAFYRGS
ncbi:MAG TPA: carboxypeptidase-like regulatory domain-containing protein [Candidatus Thermoplasmatota archaeon]|nr:carboxypeptidase-like regulatory domain-containing protein [Candidatus Thermoplasmatota archaeon]